MLLGKQQRQGWSLPELLAHPAISLSSSPSPTHIPEAEQTGHSPTLDTIHTSHPWAFVHTGLCPEGLSPSLNLQKKKKLKTAYLSQLPADSGMFPAPLSLVSLPLLWTPTALAMALALISVPFSLQRTAVQHEPLHSPSTGAGTLHVIYTPQIPAVLS